ncbi:MAG: FAH family protein [Gemmatimonadetes bacterium]|nr:FAH family protein [Gemmatimonadota bacterium]
MIVVIASDAPLRLVQLRDAAGVRRVARVLDHTSLQLFAGEATVYELALAALERGVTLAEIVRARAVAEVVAFGAAVAEARLLPPIDHPDPAHLLVSGTGLTHLGSADARDRMHAVPTEALTDSMKMFRAGLAGGRPAPGEVGVQPEWFYKGDGTSVVAGEQPLVMPAFALDGGEEPEVAGLYVIASDGSPGRLGFALANEFSDHVLERQNYLLLAHSKLRCCGLGPELRTGPLPDSVRGVSRVRRGGDVVWEQEFLTGEANMAHTIANLEHHHFKYDRFRRPGDVHVHCFGTATLSFAAGVRCEPGDAFEITADAFLLPLRNRLVRAGTAGRIGVREL